MRSRIGNRSVATFGDKACQICRSKSRLHNSAVEYYAIIICSVLGRTGKFKCILIGIRVQRVRIGVKLLKKTNRLEYALLTILRVNLLTVEIVLVSNNHNLIKYEI
jgi:hypothetical protein